MSIGYTAAMAQDTSRITAVTLYPGSATVERTARVVPGMTRLEISGLPATFDPQTVRVDSDVGARIGEVSTQVKVEASFDPKPTAENWEERQGVVAWTRTIAPNETLKFNVSYAIGYPKDGAVVGLP